MDILLDRVNNFINFTIFNNLLSNMSIIIS